MGNSVYQLISSPLAISRGFGFEDVCEKLKLVYSMVFMDYKLVVMNDPYGFRLLIMEMSPYLSIGMDSSWLHVHS